MEQYLYGSVYKVTREDRPENIRRDFELMRECGLNTVVIWPPVFYWEEKTRNYPFETGRRILEIAQDVGLKVIMELAGQLSVFEYIPDCEMKDEYYALDEHGHREWGQDSFGFLNYFHPEVKDKICEQYRRIGEAYRDFPALYAYDVFNETMYHSFDECTLGTFRIWLRKKYGTIEKLNQVWERTYSDFSQIHYEHHKWMSIMPKADYVAFRKAAIGIFLQDWCSALREADSIHPLIADNIHSQATLQGNYARPQDDYDLKNHVDEIGISFYPKGVGGVFEPAQRHQIFSAYADAAQGDGFLISEMQTHIQALFNPTTAVRPYELKQWCYEAYCAGAKALIYWMWRPFTKGLQTAGRGLVDHRDRKTERFDMAKQIGEVFTKIGPAAPATGDVGVVYDPLCEDFQYLFTEAYSVDQQIYLKSVYGAYKAMFDLGISCDMTRLEEIEKYRAVILPNQIALSAAQGQIIRRYVENGGICIVDGRFALVSEESMLYKTLPGGSVYDLCGQDLEDIDYEKLTVLLDDDSVQGYYSRDLMKLTDGTAICSFEDGRPAVVEKRTGKGAVISINTHLCYGYAATGAADLRNLLCKIAASVGITSVCDHPDVKVKRIRAEDGEHLVVFNYSNKPQTATYRAGTVEKEVALEPNEAAILPLE